MRNICNFKNLNFHRSLISTDAFVSQIEERRLDAARLEIRWSERLLIEADDFIKHPDFINYTLYL